MSVPIRYCSLSKAVDDPEAFNRIAPIMKRNLDGGHFSVFPCTCDPPCRPFEQGELESLFRRFKEWTGDQSNSTA